MQFSGLQRDDRRWEDCLTMVDRVRERGHDHL